MSESESETKRRQSHRRVGMDGIKERSKRTWTRGYVDTEVFIGMVANGQMADPVVYVLQINTESMVT